MLRRSWRERNIGFTLLELLVAMALIAIVASLTLSIMTAITSAWKAHKTRAGAFGTVRVAFETLTDRLSQATLNTYWDYDNRGAPTRYLRKSELNFIQGKASSLIPDVSDTSGDAVFFSVPLGISEADNYRPLFKMLSACGFYIHFGKDENRPPFVDARLPARYRFRLYQYLEPGERLRVYGTGLNGNWYSSDLAEWSFPMVENVIGLILRVRYPDGSSEVTSYDYDSRAGMEDHPTPVTLHQLPPVVSVTLVVIDEDSARRLADKYGNGLPPILPETGSFVSPDHYEVDLSNWEQKLKTFSPKIEYRILSSDVYIRSAKWSSH